MARFSYHCLARAVLVLVLLGGTRSPAQSNVPSWLGRESKRSTSGELAPGDSGAVDAALFFAKYKEAAVLLAQKKPQEAAITMDLASRNLTTPPWLELALLKHAQLVEQTNDRTAEQNYLTLQQRIANAPFFQSNAEKAQLFATAFSGAVNAGINRLRLRRLRDALGRYYGRYGEYPESLAKLAILGYTDMENIHAVNNQIFRYVPQSPRVNPFISYQRYDLEQIEGEPFVAPGPKLVGTSQLTEHPVRYSALIQVPGQSEPARIAEGQMIHNLLVAVVAHDGVVLSTPNQVLVIVNP